MFTSVGQRIFTIEAGPHKGKSLRAIQPFPSRLVGFSVAAVEYFVVEDLFDMEFSDGTTYCVSLNEDNLWHEVYTNETVYGKLGREACIMLDIAYNMGGSEAVAESYYSVMNTQRFDGGQTNSTLEARTLIDWCLPSVIACPETVEKIAKVYKSGVDNVSKRSIFTDSKGRSLNKYKFSKVLDRIADERTSVQRIFK